MERDQPTTADAPLESVRVMARDDEVRVGPFIRGLVWFGYGIYGGLALFFLALGIVALVALMAPESLVGERNRWPGVPLSLLAFTGVWYSAWRLKQHVKRHEPKLRSRYNRA